ncbi:MAG: hypothetical protein BIFFINMI_00464 [Phycisphaerae bacterium]|nr:hypothetical protein [Phycisphaerae bacterium]
MPPILSRYLRPEVISQLERIEFRPRGLVEGNLAGGHKSPFHGFAVEFAGHRGYVPGDDIRHIDWKVYYKSGRYVLKQYEEETNLVAHLLLDASESMEYGSRGTSKLECGKQLASALAYLILNQRDKVGAAIFDSELRVTLPTSNSIAQVHHMMTAYEGRGPTGESQVGRAVSQYAAKAGRRGIVVVLSDFFTDLERLFDGVRRLKFDKHEVVLLQIVDDDELTFPLRGMTRFVGLENLGERIIEPQRLRDSYLRKFNAFLDALTAGAELCRADYFRVNTSLSLTANLVGYLNSRPTGRRT